MSSLKAIVPVSLAPLVSSFASGQPGKPSSVALAHTSLMVQLPTRFPPQAVKAPQLEASSPPPQAPAQRARVAVSRVAVHGLFMVGRHDTLSSEPCHDEQNQGQFSFFRASR